MNVDIEGEDSQIHLCPLVGGHVQQIRRPEKNGTRMRTEAENTNLPYTLEISRFFDPSLNVTFMTDSKWFSPRHRGISLKLLQGISLNHVE